MKTISVVQGTKEWLDLRAKYFTASEAPAMMGASKYMTRNALLKLKATGIGEEITPEKQRLFDKGHAAEEAIRPYIESLIGEELYPATGVEGELLASFDGVTMDESRIFECKLWSDSLAAQVRAQEIEPHYYWQLEQQLAVSGAESAIFVVTDGTPEKCVHLEYKSQPERRKQLLAGWAQFKADLAAYVHVEAKPEAIGKAIAALPALSVQLVGQVTNSNLALYQSSALEFIDGINTDLKTDQDFADADTNIKACEKSESDLKLCKQQALEQTASIAELFRMVDLLGEKMRDKRLTLEKLVKAKKETLRIEIQQRACLAFDAHIAAINKRLGRVTLPVVRPDFAGAMKGKRTLEGTQGAVDDALAAAKIATSEIAERMSANLAELETLAAGHAFLFNDLQQIVGKEPGDFVNLVNARVSAHKADQDRKAEAQREQIRKEERERAQREAEERARQQREADARAQEAAKPAPEPAKPVVVAPAPPASKVAPITRYQSKPARPSDYEIVEALCDHFDEEAHVVIEWLSDMVLDAAFDGFNAA